MYSIDGSVVATHNAAIRGVDAPGGERLRRRRSRLSVDWLDMTPYTSPCTYQSHSFDAGSGCPTGRLSTATRRRPARDRTHHRDADFGERHRMVTVRRVVPGTTIASPDNRYLQYRATLTDVRGREHADARGGHGYGRAGYVCCRSRRCSSHRPGPRPCGELCLVAATCPVGQHRRDERRVSGSPAARSCTTSWSDPATLDDLRMDRAPGHDRRHRTGPTHWQSVASDAAGNTGTSASITVSVDNAPPSASVARPGERRVGARYIRSCSTCQHPTTSRCHES